MPVSVPYSFNIVRGPHEADCHAAKPVLDMHGVPGSQNGEQSSGQLTKNAAFFGGDANTLTSSQVRADEMIKAVIQFVETSPYRSVITGIEVCLIFQSSLSQSVKLNVLRCLR